MDTAWGAGVNTGSSWDTGTGVAVTWATPTTRGVGSAAWGAGVSTTGSGVGARVGSGAGVKVGSGLGRTTVRDSALSVWYQVSSNWMPADRVPDMGSSSIALKVQTLLSGWSTGSAAPVMGTPAALSTRTPWMGPSAVKVNTVLTPV